jgi:hypothetical protein
VHESNLSTFSKSTLLLDDYRVVAAGFAVDGAELGTSSLGGLALLHMQGNDR